jgi:serine/threonine protein kinase
LAEEMGGGPTGEVYRSKVYGVAGFERQFAVKRFHPELVRSPATAAKIAGAARAYGSMEHPHIARLHEFGVAGGETFTATEYVEGLDLAMLVFFSAGTGHSLPPGAVATLVGQAARAVGYVHGRGHRHLGLCPTNIIADRAGDVKVTDFGVLPPRLPKRPAQDPALDSRIPYLAPEQLVGEATSPATDVYQLGVVAFELFAGRLPFIAPSAFELAQQILSGQPAEPPLGKPMSKVLKRCLARSPFERYPDADALAEAIDDAIRQEPLPGDRGAVAAVVDTHYDSLRQQRAAGSTAVPPLPAPCPPQVDGVFATPAPEARRVVRVNKGPSLDELKKTMHTVISPSRGDVEDDMATIEVESDRAETIEVDTFENQITIPDRSVPTPDDDDDAETEMLATQVHNPVPEPRLTPAFQKPLSKGLSALAAEEVSNASPMLPVPGAVAPPHQPAPPPHQPAPPPHQPAPPPHQPAPPLHQPAPPPHQPPLQQSPVMAPTDPRPGPEQHFDEPVPMHLQGGPGQPVRSKKPIVLGFIAFVAVGAIGFFVTSHFVKKKAEEPKVVVKDNDNASTTAAANANEPDRPVAAAKDAGATTAVAAVTKKDAGAEEATGDAKDAGTVTTTAGDTGSVKPTSDGKLNITSNPAGAQIYLDGSEVGETPLSIDATKDSHRIALLLAGYKLYVTDVSGSSEVTANLEAVTPPEGPAGIKVRCKKKNRYYVFVDGVDIGQLCPTERIGVNKGSHVVEIYDPVTDARSEFRVEVKETRRSLRVRVD